MERQRMFGFVTRGLAVLLLLASAVGVRAESVDKLPKPTGYVSDFADVLDAASEAQMEALCEQVDKQAHAQIAVVTIHSLDGDTIEDFASKLEEKWKVGAKGTDRGLLMLFAINDHKRWIEVGYGLEGILNDAKVGDIGRSMVPQLEQKQYGPAILGGLVQISNVIAKDANVTLTQAQPDEDEAPPRAVHSTHHGSNVGSIFRILFFLFVLIMIFKGGGRGGGSGWLWFLAGNMLGGGGGGRDRGGWGGGGGDSGGGGGFGGFGGGSSGGGGAGGDW